MLVAYLILFLFSLAVFVTALLMTCPEVPLTDEGSPLLGIADSIDFCFLLTRRAFQPLRGLARFTRSKIFATFQEWGKTVGAPTTPAKTTTVNFSQDSYSLS